MNGLCRGELQWFKVAKRLPFNPTILLQKLSALHHIENDSEFSHAFFFSSIAIPNQHVLLFFQLNV